jgi:putative holliday junction resolvase
MQNRFLGIDYGKKRVGLAISDEDGQLAFPFKVLKNNSELLDMVHNICGEENVKEIVIGESLNLVGKKNEIMQEIDAFRTKLAELRLPIHFEKEFMTSVEARGRSGKEKNNARKIKISIKKTNVDDQAAALILQRFLDKRNKK